MKNIKSFNVLGQKIKVRHVKMEDGFLGLFWSDDNRIDINIDCPREKIPETICHELFHSAFKRAGLDQCMVSHDAQELICEQFSKVITENFRLIKK